MRARVGRVPGVRASSSRSGSSSSSRRRRHGAGAAGPVELVMARRTSERAATGAVQNSTVQYSTEQRRATLDALLEATLATE